MIDTRTIKLLATITVAMTVILLMVISCSRKDNPLSVEPDNSNQSGVTNLMGPGDVALDPIDGAELTPLDRPIYLMFDRYMDASTINAANIVVTRAVGGEELSVDIEVEYLPGPHMAKITASDFEFIDNSAFVLTLTSGIKDFSGAPFDGNGNGVADSVGYDRHRSLFYTGTGNANLPDITSPRINMGALYPPSETTWLPMDSAFFRITVGFTGGDIDTLRLDTSVMRIYNLGAANSGAIDTIFVPNLLALEARSVNSVTYRLESPDDTTRLVRGNRYLAELTASAISDTSGNPLLWGDEVNDGSVADFHFGFIIEPDAGQDITPPIVISVNEAMFNGSWRSVVTFSENTEMDTTTFNHTNVAFFGSDMVRLDGYFLNDAFANGIVFYPRQGTERPVYYYIDLAVADTAGNLLDGNSNGLGGEPEDYFTNLP